ncbi:MAG: YobA family protein [Oscillospiraceae bacterium]|nr:YobA family protein [Oscillospiraceae bacterium]
MKQLLSILLALTMLFCFAGCQFVEDPDDTDDEVVGGGLVQARDGEEIDDVEDEDSSYIVLSDITNYTPEEGVNFYALVISVGDNSLAVCGLNTVDSNNEGLYTVGFSDDAEVTGRVTSFDEITAGDIVVITFNGEVMESYPAQISGATRVYVVTHVDRLSEIEPYLPEGYEGYGEYFPAWDDFEY